MPRVLPMDELRLRAWSNKTPTEQICLAARRPATPMSQGWSLAEAEALVAMLLTAETGGKRPEGAMGVLLGALAVLMIDTPTASMTQMLKPKAVEAAVRRALAQVHDMRAELALKAAERRQG